jgi:hypothetical protein
MRARGDYESALIADPTGRERHELDENEWYWNECAKEIYELDELDKPVEQEELSCKKPPAPSIKRGDIAQTKDVA